MSTSVNPVNSQSSMSRLRTWMSRSEKHEPETPAATVALSPEAVKAARTDKRGIIGSLLASAAGVGMVAAGVVMTGPLAPLVFAVGGTVAVLGVAGALTFAGVGSNLSRQDTTTIALVTLSVANSTSTLNNLN